MSGALVRSKRGALATACLFLMSAGRVQAATGGDPLTMSHSGYLLDASDQPLTAATSMTFRIFDAVAAGTVQWEGTCGSVAVKNGYYAVVLGASPCVGSSAGGLDSVLDTAD